MGFYDPRCEAICQILLYREWSASCAPHTRCMCMPSARGARGRGARDPRPSCRSNNILVPNPCGRGWRGAAEAALRWGAAPAFPPDTRARTGGADLESPRPEDPVVGSSRTTRWHACMVHCPGLRARSAVQGCPVSHQRQNRHKGIGGANY